MVVVAYGNRMFGAGRFTGKNGLPAGDNASGSGKELGEQLLGGVFRVFLCPYLDGAVGFFKKIKKFWFST